MMDRKQMILYDYNLPNTLSKKMFFGGMFLTGVQSYLLAFGVLNACRYSWVQMILFSSVFHYP